MWNALLKLVGGGIGEKVSEYFVARQELKNKLKLTILEGKINLESAKFAARVSQQTHTQDWEMASLAKHSGYKDDVVLFVILGPYVGAFIPGVQDHVLIGFQYLAQMPYWAIGLTVTICLAIYGIRHKNASRIQAPGLRDEDVNTKE
jgi:hypothetical protein